MSEGFLFSPNMAKTFKGLHLKKSLGQHYLHDQNVCKKIVQAIADIPLRNILEVGPGSGAISEHLFKAAEFQYQGIEMDEEKVEFLKSQFPDKHFIQGDFLKHSFSDEEVHVFGNFPYNISGPIAFKILENKNIIPYMTGMFQKEVAQRLLSGHGNKVYGILSVLMQCFYDCNLLFDVQAGSFVPPPKVTSAIIQCSRNENPYEIDNFLDFKKVVKTAFGQRRKTLSNALKALYPELPERFKKLRAEQLSPEQFAELYHELKR